MARTCCGPNIQDSGVTAWAGAHRAGVPHARISDVDFSRAESLPGTNRQGILHKDQPVLTSILQIQIPWNNLIVLSK